MKSGMEDVSQKDDEVESEVARTPPPSVESETESETTPLKSEEVEKLTHGLLGLFLPNLQKSKGFINEALHNQEILMETVVQENTKFTDSEAMKQMTEVMEKASAYHGKLLSLQKEMNGIMDKSTKLKRRAVKLQQQKHKEVLDRAVQRDRELDREKMLAAKVVRPASKPED